jgi:hypothetical protein
MLKITLAVAAAAAVLTLTTAPLATPSMAQDLKMAQGVDVQIGRTLVFVSGPSVFDGHVLPLDVAGQV